MWFQVSSEQRIQELDNNSVESFDAEFKDASRDEQRGISRHRQAPLDANEIKLFRRLHVLRTDSGPKSMGGSPYRYVLRPAALIVLGS